MSNISIDAALKLLPTGGKSPLPLDEVRAPKFDQHLDRARAERTPTVPVCPPPPAAPVARETTQRDSGHTAEANGGSDDATARSQTSAAAEDAPVDDAAPQEDESTASDEVEISVAATAAAGAAAASPTEATDKNPAATTGKSKLESAIQAVHPKSDTGVTAADAAAAATEKPAHVATDAKVSAEAAEGATTPAVVANAAEEVGAAASKDATHATKGDSVAEFSGSHAGSATQLKARPVVNEAAHAGAANQTAAKQAAGAVASQDAPTTASAAASTPTAATRSAIDRAGGSRREGSDQKNSVVPETAASITQILVSAEPITAGTSVITADAEVDSIQWTASAKQDAPVSMAEVVAPVETPVDAPDPSSRFTATSVGDARPTHSGRLDGLPAVGRHAAPSSQDQISPADRIRLVQRVARALHAAADRGGEVRLRLSPPELGSLRMEVVVQHGQMSAHIETETSAARSALLDNLPALRSRLAEQDITVARFDVDVMDNPAEGNHQQYDQDGDWSRQASGSRTNSTARPRSEASEPAQPTRAAAGSSSELNIVV